jgi:phosphoribulokinase
MENERLLCEAIPVVCEFCVYRNHRVDIRCTEECHSLDAYNKVIADAIAALIEQLLNYVTDYYSLTAWNFVKKYPDIETDVSDGQWIAQYLNKLKESVKHE